MITYGYGADTDGSATETCYLSVHNVSSHKVAVSEVRYLAGFRRKPRIHGTALYFLDPFDLSFPYEVDVGQIRNLRLDETGARRSIRELTRFQILLCRLFRRPRIWVQLTTSMGTRRKVPCEKVLDWDEQASWTKQ